MSALRKAIAQAIFDPGLTEGFKGDRTLAEWQTDAVMRVLATIPRGAAYPAPALLGGGGDVWAIFDGQQWTSAEADRFKTHDLVTTFDPAGGITITETEKEPLA